MICFLLELLVIPCLFVDLCADILCFWGCPNGSRHCFVSMIIDCVMCFSAHSLALSCYRFALLQLHSELSAQLQKPVLLHETKQQEKRPCVDIIRMSKALHEKMRPNKRTTIKSLPTLAKPLLCVIAMTFHRSKQKATIRKVRNSFWPLLSCDLI